MTFYGNGLTWKGRTFMKKLFALFLTFVLTFSLGACSTNNSAKSSVSESDTSMTDSSRTPSETEGTSSNETKETANALILYFSMSETTNPDNMTQEEDNSVVVINGEVLGNTKYVAYVIQENTGRIFFASNRKILTPSTMNAC